VAVQTSKKERKNGRRTGIHSEHERGITEQIHKRKVPQRILENYQYYQEVSIILVKIHTPTLKT